MVLVDGLALPVMTATQNGQPPRPPTAFLDQAAFLDQGHGHLFGLDRCQVSFDRFVILVSKLLPDKSEVPTRSHHALSGAARW